LFILHSGGRGENSGGEIKMEKIWRLGVLFALFFVLGILTSMLAGDISHFFIKQSGGYEFASEEQTLQRCSNLSLEKTAKCLNNFVVSNYDYNSSALNATERPLSTKNLFTYGGVCFDYAMFYINMSKRLGFDAEEVSAIIGNTPHSIALLSTNGTYCILDQTKFKCFKVKK